VHHRFLMRAVTDSQRAHLVVLELDFVVRRIYFGGVLSKCRLRNKEDRQGGDQKASYTIACSSSQI